MSQDRRDGSAALPADDLPSPEVLDELLRAFSADAADERTLQEIDLASPEVEDLLAPTSPTPPPVLPESQPEVEVEVEVEAVGSLEGGVEGEVVDEDVPAGGDETRDHPEPGDEPDPEPPATPEPDAELPPSPAPPNDDAAASQGTTRTIRIDASNDPPDAVYLAAGDPLLAASAGARGLTGRPLADDVPPAETTVFIDDHEIGEGETISLADASKATQIEPRLRERRIAVKRAVGRKRLRWVVLGAGVAVLLIAALAVLGSGLFAIDEVRIDGAVYTDPVALQSVVDELEGTPVLRADTDRAEEELEAIPWVADARVTAQFPDRATIELRERTPVATFQGPDQRYRVIDLDARVLDVLDGQPEELLLVTSPEAADLVPGQFATPGFVAASNLVSALTPELRALAGGVSVTADGGDLRMALTDGREIRFGPGRDLVTKLVRLQTKLEDLAAGGFQYVDVSTDEITTG